MLETQTAVTKRLDAEMRQAHSFDLDWYDVLLQLYEAGGRLRMSALADATLFSRTDCTRLVDRMGKAGLVERIRAPEDGRGLYAALTPAGRSTFRAAAATHLAGIERWFGSRIDSADADVLAAMLEPIRG